MSSAIPPSTVLPITPAVPHAVESAAAGSPSFAASAQTASAGAGQVPTPPPSTSAPTGSAPASAPASTAAPTTPADPSSAPPPASATAPATPVAPASGVASAAQVAQIVAATQAALSSSVNLSPQAQQAVKVEAFNQLVANLVNQVQAGSATLPSNWPTAGVSPAMHTLVTALLQQATANQPLPQQLVSIQAWPTALAHAVLQLAGQSAAAPAANVLQAALPAGAPASPASATDIRLPALQNWLVQQGSIQGTDGERSFTLTLRVPVAWAQAQAALGAALPQGTPMGTGAGSHANAAAALLASPAQGFGFGIHTAADGLLPLSFAGSVQQLSNSSMGLVMQPQLLPGSPAAAAAQAMRTSAILALEFQPLAQAVQSAQVAAVYMPAHLQQQEVQAMLQNRVTDPWLMMAQAEGQGKKQPRNANEQAQFCNRAGCQYQGRAICAQPFCAEMNYLWSVDRAHRSGRL